MILWILWTIGIVITIITKYSIKKTFTPFRENIGRWNEKIIYPKVSQQETKTKILFHLLVIVCIILVGGIAVGKFVGMFYEVPFWEQILIGILPAFLTYIVGDLILKLTYYFDDVRSHFCFVLVFIISILGWTILINNYNRNFEEKTEVVIEQTQERKLLFFCNVPVQEITGKVTSSPLGGNVSGSINTSHELTYWYVNENGKWLFDTSPANSSEIDPLEEGESPYVELLYYYQCQKRIDHNIGSETIFEEKRWIHYIFHLPETIMQYALD